MKLFQTTIASHKSQPGTLLHDGTESDIIRFINGVGDGWAIGGPLDESDLDENGGNWGSLPDGWSAATPYYFDTPTDRIGGFASETEALHRLIALCENYLLEDAPPTPDQMPMTIKFLTTEAGFDPNALLPEEAYNKSIDAYEAEIKAAILQEYPNAEIDFYRSIDHPDAPAGEQETDVILDDPNEDPSDILDKILRISEKVFETGTFWATNND